MHIKVKGGTRSPDALRLCDTCKHSAIRRGPADSQEDVECRVFSRRVSFRVVECPSYHPSNHPWIHEMESIAWIVQTDRLGRTVGFRHPSDDDRSQRPPAGFGAR